MNANFRIITLGCESHGAASVRALVAAAFLLVHCQLPAQCQSTAAPAAPAHSPAVVVEDDTALPANVIEMRELILAAVRSGRIGDLVDAIEWNELPPEFGKAAGDDPVAYWRKTSADGEGREVLAVLGNILAMPPARLPVGADVENNAIYVWPYLAEQSLDTLSPAAEVDLLRLMPASDARLMRESKRWTWWRLAISADGTWLTFQKHN